MRTAVSDEVDRLAGQMKGRAFGAVRILSAAGRLDENSFGQVGTFFSLVLDDPRGETWPTDDMFELRRTLRDEIAEHIEGPVYFEFEPATAESLAEDEIDPART